MKMRLGLIGYPLGSSYSRQLHEQALKALNLEGSYQLWEIPPGPDELEELTSRVEALREGKLGGINVTIPYKETVLPLADRLTPAARTIGAVNTLYREPGGNQVMGDNTDSPGFWTDLQQLLPPERQKGGGSALVLGAGGAARAVTYALASRSWRVTVAARRAAQAEELAADFRDLPGSVWPVPLTSRDGPSTTGCGLIVNATPVGMAPGLNLSPWPDYWSFPRGCVVYDLVYNPRETSLMKQAGEVNLPVRNGLGMLIEQAALAFAHWTGQPPPREIMSRTVRRQQTTFSQIKDQQQKQKE